MPELKRKVKGSWIGTLEVGKKADIVIFDAPNHKYFAYHYGMNLAAKVFKDGKLVVENGRRVTPNCRADRDSAVA